MLDSTQSLKSDTPKAQIEDVLFALGSVASHVGEVTGVLLVLVQLLARDGLISMVDAKKLIGLLSAESPEVRRHVNAQCGLRRKPRSIRPLKASLLARGTGK